MYYQNYYTYLEDFSFRDSEREKEYRHDDWIDQVLKHSCPSAAAQGRNDRYDDDTQAQPSSVLDHLNTTGVNEDWSVVFNDGSRLDKHFFDETGVSDIGASNYQFTIRVPWDAELSNSTAIAHPAQPVINSADFRTARDTRKYTPFFASASALAEQSSQSSESDSDIAIGTAMKNGQYKCVNTLCAKRSFKRPAELKRHYHTTHAVEKPEFWCEVTLCNRSAAAGGKPFHRKYRLQDHMRKMHTHQLNTLMDIDMAEG